MPRGSRRPNPGPAPVAVAPPVEVKRKSSDRGCTAVLKDTAEIAVLVVLLILFLVHGMPFILEDLVPFLQGL
jgi:hypothetical protein